MTKNNPVALLRSGLIATLMVMACATPLRTNATVMGIAVGDLVKLKGDTAVYYLDRDWRRHPFPNLDVYYSWFKDFGGIKELSKDDMAQLRLGAPVIYRPGARLIKITSDPKVYAVEPGGVLRAIASESVAKSLYGDAWSKRVMDVPDSLFFGYKIGLPLTLPVHTTGTVIRRTSDGSLFVIDGSGKRHAPPAIAQQFSYRDPYVINASGTLDEYDDLAPLADGLDRKYRDVAQDSRVETLPPPIIEFPTISTSVVAPSDATVAAISITSGIPTTLRRIIVTLKGTLRDNGIRMIENVHVVDSKGADVFGTQQVSENAGLEHKFIFEGAYAMLENSSNTFYLKANVHPLMKKGDLLTTVFDRSGIRLSDDSAGGTATDDFFPRTAFPPIVVTIK